MKLWFHVGFKLDLRHHPMFVRVVCVPDSSICGSCSEEKHMIFSTEFIHAFLNHYIRIDVSKRKENEASFVQKLNTHSDF